MGDDLKSALVACVPGQVWLNAQGARQCGCATRPRGGRATRVARFTTLDPFAGNLVNPLSLNKYLFAASDGINKNDPTGMYEGLSGTLAVSAVSSVLVGMVAEAATPFLSKYAQKLIPKPVMNAIQYMQYDAITFGANALVTESTGWKGAGIGGTLGLELLLSPHTGRMALYWYAGGVAFLGGPSNSVIGALSLGFTWRTRRSNDYEGSFWTFSMGFSSLTTQAQKNVQARYVSLLTTPVAVGANGLLDLAPIPGLQTAVNATLNKSQFQILQISERIGLGIACSVR